MECLETLRKNGLADFLLNLNLVNCVGFKISCDCSFFFVLFLFFGWLFHSILYQSCSLSSLLQEVMNH